MTVSHALSGRRIIAAIVLGFTFLAATPAAQTHGPPTESPEAIYLAESDRAMTAMMRDMAIHPTGDMDRDFVAMMVPHHQGAIDMALAVLRHGRNEKVKRLAQEIIVTQQEEIAAMRLAVGEPLPPSVSSPAQPHRSPSPRSE